MVGRSENGNEIYFCSETKKTEKGIFPYGTPESITSATIDSYEIPSEGAYRELNMRKVELRRLF